MYFFVPELKKNLFSEGIITKKGMKIVKEGNKVTIYAEKKIVAIGTRQSNNIYTMHFRTVMNQEANIIQKDDFKLWHERLGHINQCSVQKLINEGILNGNKFTSKEHFFCEACLYGKQHRQSFAKTSHMYGKPCERIFSDLCGPIPARNGTSNRHRIDVDLFISTSNRCQIDVDSMYHSHWDV